MTTKMPSRLARKLAPTGARIRPPMLAPMLARIQARMRLLAPMQAPTGANIQPPGLALLAALLVLSPPLSAQQEAPPAGGTFLEAPTLAPTPIAGEAVEPDITIVESGDQTVYEYRVRGQLYMVRIQPMIGAPYYLLDTDGDGIMDVRDTSPQNIAVPQWVLFSWD